MKKLLILVLLTIGMSQTSMAMGFPHTAFSQHRTLLSKGNGLEVFQEVKQVQEKVKDKIEAEKSSLSESLIQKICDFMVKVFSSVFSTNKSLAIQQNFAQKIGIS